MPKRPSALDVSFGDVPDEPEPSPQPTKPVFRPKTGKGYVSAESTSSTPNNSRRGTRTAGSGSGSQSKRRRLKSNTPPPSPRQATSLSSEEELVAGYYERENDTINETDDLLLPREDPEDAEEENMKSIRDLTNFRFFNNNQRFVSLSVGDLTSSGVIIRGAGLVCHHQNQEDQGQEDDLEDDMVNLHLDEIVNVSIDYTDPYGPMYVETCFAWYELKLPHDDYEEMYKKFYKPHAAAQLIISSLNQDTTVEEYERILFHDGRDPTFLELFTAADLDYTILRRAVETVQDPHPCLDSPVLTRLLRTSRTNLNQPIAQRRQEPSNARYRPPPIIGIGDLDQAVLMNRNLSPTTVTRSIAADIRNLFRERMYIVGPMYRVPSADVVRREEDGRLQRLKRFVRLAARERRVEIAPHQREKYLQYVKLDGQTYRIGDTILVAMNEDRIMEADVGAAEALTFNNTIQEFFRFGCIMWMSRIEQTIHVCWLKHSSKTLIQELHTPQELFLTDDCSSVAINCISQDIPMKSVVTQVTVHFGRIASNDDPVPGHEFFCWLKYKPENGSYIDFAPSNVRLKTFTNLQDRITTSSTKPECPCCDKLDKEEDAADTGLETIKDGPRVIGVSRAGGERFHVNDFILVRHRGDADALGRIGHVENLKYESLRWTFSVRWFGRVNEISHDVLPEDYFRDERELYLTNDRSTVYLGDIIRKCYILPERDLRHVPGWTSNSPYHFYASCIFPKLEVTNWNRKLNLSVNDMSSCTLCLADLNNHIKDLNKFLEEKSQAPLRALDLCAGAGAFGFGMLEGMEGSLTITHAVEIMPSAAQTYKQHSPDTIVYNQCMNAMLQYAVKSYDGLFGENDTHPKQLYDQETLVAEPYRPEDIDVLICGLPCQPHSAMNQFKKAEDKKSNLLLNCLSHIDFLRPEYVYVENVRGFVAFRLNSVQVDAHRVRGGIEAGGLKLFYHSLIMRGYQVRCGLLQAAHFGVPQSRVRFFLIAAQRGLTLPELPQPFCSFPIVDKLELKLGQDAGALSFRPINANLKGVAPHRYVTIEEAISDLPEYDWKNPRKEKENPEQRTESRRRRHIKSYECKHGASFCGPQDTDPIFYESEPMTSFQKQARENPTRKLQHYTRVFRPLTVERVVTLPIRAGADYHDLRPDLSEWHLYNPASAVARDGFRPGAYSRLDAKKWFNTTVTNIGPTAKQNKVVHPTSRRILSVRELMRSQSFPDSFAIESRQDNIITIHRQVGNAVPWLLSKAIGSTFRDAVFNDWKAHQAAIAMRENR